MGTNSFGRLSVLVARDCFSSPEASEFLEDEANGTGGGREGAGNLMSKSGDLDGERVRLLDTEVAGEADFEHG